MNIDITFTQAVEHGKRDVWGYGWSVSDTNKLDMPILLMALMSTQVIHDRRDDIVCRLNDLAHDMPDRFDDIEAISNQIEAMTPTVKLPSPLQRAKSVCTLVDMGTMDPDHARNVLMALLMSLSDDKLEVLCKDLNKLLGD